MFKFTARSLSIIIVYCIINSCLSIGILVITNNIISEEQIVFANHREAIFFLMVLTSFILNLSFQRKLTAYSNKIIYDNELRIIERFLAANASQLDKFGTQRIYGAIEDIRTLSILPGMISSSITLLFMLIACMGYFILLSLPSTLFVISLIAGIISMYMIINKKLALNISQLRSLNDTYFKLVDDIIKGFRELKLSLQKRTNLEVKFLYPNRALARDKDTYVSNHLSLINLLSQYGLYFIIGIVIFVLPQMNLLNKREVTAFVVILLFIRGPINALTGMQAFFTKAFAANKRVSIFLDELQSLSPDIEPNPIFTNEYSNVIDLKFENVNYEYPTLTGINVQALTNINLEINSGEVIFIIGGNGSGKSTFVNILTGIYLPMGGKVYLNGSPISNNSQLYRSKIAAVFSESHLFSENFEDYPLVNNAAYTELLKTMKLDKVVTEDTEAAARKKFSKGQGKRMALIFALLEKKPILVLDEWAADQEPHFRKYFYEVLIKRFRQQGKTIIAVTHDDSYFHYADRIVKFDQGQIVQDIFTKKDIIDLNQEKSRELGKN